MWNKIALSPPFLMILSKEITYYLCIYSNTSILEMDLPSAIVRADLTKVFFSFGPI